MRGSGIVRIKAHLSAAMLTAATGFALQARQIEESVSGKPSDGDWERHRTAALVAVVLSAAFVEGAVNEHFRYAVDRDPNVFKGFAEADLDLLTELWELLEEHGASALRKCQAALIALRKPEFERGAEPYQSVTFLFDFRDAIMHFKPEWDTDNDEHAKLAKRLRGLFPESPFATRTQVFFPHRCLSAGASVWACRTATRVVEEFTTRLGVKSPLAPALAETATRLGR